MQFAICSPNKSVLTVIFFLLLINAHSQKKIGEQSVLSDSRLYQLEKNPTHVYGTTRHFIASNLAVDIAGLYPENVKPNWLYIADERYTRGWPLHMDMQAFISAKSKLKEATLNIKLIPNKNNGKAILVVGSNYGELDIKGELAVIVKGRQTFKIPYFNKISKGVLTEEKFEGGANRYVAGGMAGEVSLMADDNGNITLSLIIEYYRTASRFKEAGVFTRYVVNDFLIENQLTPKLYFDIKRSDSLYADRMKKMDEAEQAAFEEEIKDSYKKVMNAQAAYETLKLGCIHDTSGTISGYRTTYESVETVLRDPSTGGFDYQYSDRPVSRSYSQPFSGITNSCSKPVIILGIEKRQSRKGTIYYVNSSIKLEPGELVRDVKKVNIINSFNPKSGILNETYYYINKLK